MNFEEYLVSKKIDSAAFKSAEAERWNEWNKLFPEVNPNSFTSQKLYLINPIRRKYPLKQSTQTASAEQSPEKPKPAKPVFKPKMN